MRIGGIAALAGGLALAGAALAKAPPNEAARLGKDLTPVGAERAGNAAGTIPSWTGKPAFGPTQIGMTRAKLEDFRIGLMRDIQAMIADTSAVEAVLNAAQQIVDADPAKLPAVMAVLRSTVAATATIKADFDKVLSPKGKSVDVLLASVEQRRMKITDLLPDIQVVIRDYNAKGQLARIMPAFEPRKILPLVALMGDGKSAPSAGDLLAKYMPPNVNEFLTYNIPGRKPEEFLKPVYIVTRANLPQYEALLSEGHKAMFKAYPTYKMIVYPSVRNAFFPPEIEQATIKNAATATLRGTDSLENAELGFPFPIPQGGAEPIWNHKTKFRGSTVRRFNNQAIVKPDGDFKITKLVEDVLFVYPNLKRRAKPGEKMIVYYLQEAKEPPRIAGQVTLVHEKMGPGAEARSAWIFTPGLGRVNRAPDVGYDNPAIGTDSEQTFDQIDMYNGALDKYTWKLVGKKEVLIPYNNWIMNSPTFKYADLIRPGHMNQDLVRYELHRVWVVEATLRPGVRHLFKKRRFYLDEDSWSIAIVDCYDNRDQLWKVQEGALITIPFIPTVSGIPEVIYDVLSKRYFLTTMTNEDPVSDFEINYDEKIFTPAALQRRAARR